MDEPQVRPGAPVRGRRRMLAAGSALAVAPWVARAQTGFPTRPVRIVIPFAGSGSDVFVRYVADRLPPVLGGTAIVENRGGGDGVVGALEVLRAAPDGHTMLLGSSSTISLAPFIKRDLPYDPNRDFRPVVGITRAPAVIVVPAGSRYDSLASLTAAARSRPDTVTMATYSPAFRLAATWLETLVQGRFTHVAYKGFAQSSTDLMGGSVDAGLLALSASIPFIQSGKMRALAVTGPGRDPQVPDVPSVRESHPDYAFFVWIGFFVPAKTPDAPVRQLSEAVRRVLATAEAKDYFAKAGGEVLPLTPEEMGTMQSVESARFAALARTAGIEPQ